MKNCSLLFITIVLVISCSSTKNSEAKINCVETIYHPDGSDTSIVKLNQSWVFDTTAIQLKGHLMDSKTLQPITNAVVRFQNENPEYFYTETSDNNGDFDFFLNLEKGQWDLRIEAPEYRCLIVKDIIHTGGQWFNFKMKHH